MRLNRLLLAAAVIAMSALLPMAAQAAATFTVSPTSLSFGSVALAQSKQLVITVKNSTTVNQSYQLAVPAGTPFHRYLPSPAVSTDCMQGPDASATYLVVAPKGSCTLHVEFTPAVLGAASTVLNLTAYATAGAVGAQSTLGAAGATITVKATGTGVAAKVSASPTTVAFSKVLLSDRAEKTTVLKNSSLGSVVFTPVYPTASGYLAPAVLSDTSSCYSATGKKTGPAYLSRVVGPGETCTLYVDFAPQKAASLPDTMTVTAHQSSLASGTYTSATNGQAVAALAVKLTGTGTAPTYTASPKALAFGKIAYTTSTELDSVIKNTSTLPLYLRPVFADSIYDLPVVTSGNPGDCVVRTAAHRTGMRLDPGASCTLRVLYSPVVGEPVKSTVSIDAYRAPATGAPYVDAQNLGMKLNSVPIALSGTGTGPAIAANPAKVAFSKVTLTNSGEANVTIENNSTVPLFFKASFPAHSQYSLTVLPTGSDCLIRNGSTLSSMRVDPGQTCFLWIYFTPTVAGAQNDTLTVNAYPVPGNAQSDAGLNDGAAVNTLPVPMTGTGVAPDFSVSPTSLSFGTVPKGTTKSLTETITNKSDIVLQFAFGLTGDASYRIVPVSGGCVSSSGQGLAVDSKGTCTVSVTFTPTAAGKVAATLLVSAREAVGAIGAYAPYKPASLNSKKVAVTGTGGS